MTVFQMDGFETYGDKLTSGADVESRFSDTDAIGDGVCTYQIISGGHATGNVSLIDGDLLGEVDGLALEFPDTQTARGEWMTYQFPDGTGRFDDYIVPTNASVPVFISGCRVYNAAVTPASTITNTIFGGLTSSTSAGFTLRINSNGTDLELVDDDATVHTAVGALIQSQWHYIEVEWKLTTAASGGYAKVYVDGVEVIDTGTVDLVNFTFFNTYGFRWGVASSGGNQSGGENWAFDDIYCLEMDGVEHTGPLAESSDGVKVGLMSPANDATPNDWSPSTGGDNYALVDEQDWDETDYVEAATTADDDHYGLSTAPTVLVIHGMQVDTVCEATDGTPNLHIGFDDGTADEEDKGVIGTAAPVQVRQFFETDPSGADWTESSAASVETTIRMTE